MAEGKLNIHLNSFSFLKRGYPLESSSHRGGFIFDCRALTNPGRYDQYKNLSGKDQCVIDILDESKDVQRFFNNSRDLIEQMIENYLERKFTFMVVNFGCTGGQHRSVYMAEKTAKYLQDKYSDRAIVHIQHLDNPC